MLSSGLELLYFRRVIMSSTSCSAFWQAVGVPVIVIVCMFFSSGVLVMICVWVASLMLLIVIPPFPMICLMISLLQNIFMELVSWCCGLVSVRRGWLVCLFCVVVSWCCGLVAVCGG